MANLGSRSEPSSGKDADIDQRGIEIIDRKSLTTFDRIQAVSDARHRSLTPSFVLLSKWHHGWLHSRINIVSGVLKKQSLTLQKS